MSAQPSSTTELLYIQFCDLICGGNMLRALVLT